MLNLTAAVHFNRNHIFQLSIVFVITYNTLVYFEVCCVFTFDLYDVQVLVSFFATTTFIMNKKRRNAVHSQSDFLVSYVSSSV